MGAKKRVRPHVTMPLKMSNLNQNLNWSTILPKFCNVKFHKNPFKGSRIIMYLKTDKRKYFNMRLKRDDRAYKCALKNQKIMYFHLHIMCHYFPFNEIATK